LAGTFRDYADAIREGNREVDWDMAMALLDESQAISPEICVCSLMERVLSLRDILKA
jgi:hypothetical protein